jgi:hypothetical protein
MKEDVRLLLKKIHDKNHQHSVGTVQEPNLVSFWLRARKAAGCRPHPVITEWVSS